MNHKPSAQPHIQHVRLGAYVFGFIASLGLTLLAYYAVTAQTHVGWQVYVTIVSLALAQLVVQLVFFLHLGRESKPRWNLLVFMFMALVVVLLVGGTLWIMYNLNYMHMLPAADQNTHQIHEEGLHN